jgi:hypothetical protein
MAEQVAGFGCQVLHGRVLVHRGSPDEVFMKAVPVSRAAQNP